jgi:hypothetical protein
MLGEKKDERPQGFVVILGDCEERPGKNWARMYLSKIRGPKEDFYCGPNLLELMRKIKELLINFGCWQVTILSKPYPEGHPREEIIRQARNYYPEVKVIYMSYF